MEIFSSPTSFAVNDDQLELSIIVTKRNGEPLTNDEEALMQKSGKQLHQDLSALMSNPVETQTPA